MDQEETSNPFNIEFVQALVHLMADRDLSVVNLKWQGAKIKLVRGAQITQVATMPPTSVAYAAPSAAAPAPASPPPAAAVAPEPKPGKFITSPAVGTFYLAASPEAEPYVKVGTKVQDDSVVCIIEAMKVFNQITAGLSGTVVEILVENGAPVEYGQPLFRVEA